MHCGVIWCGSEGRIAFALHECFVALDHRVKSLEPHEQFVNIRIACGKSGAT